MTSPDSAEGGIAPVAAPTSAVPARRKRTHLPRVVGAVALLVLLGGTGAYTAINLPRGCGVFGGARHDVPCEVPLPSGASYERPFTIPGGTPASVTERGWLFVAPHGMSGQDLHAFFAQQLPANGWRCITDDSAGLPPEMVEQTATFTAYRDRTGLSITYRGDTGEFAIVTDDFHGVLPSPC